MKVTQTASISKRRRIQVLSRLLTCFSAAVLGLFPSGCLSEPAGAAPISSTPAGAEVTFERYDTVLGVAERQTVLTGFLLDGPIADLAVVRIDKNGDRRLRIYAFQGGAWKPSLDATLRPEASFVDVANIGGRDRLIAYGRGRLSWFDPESGTERGLAAATSSFKPPRGGEIPHVDLTRDVNGDGRDDLVVPDQDGFWVFVQTEGGAFADPVKLGPPADLSGISGADGYRYDPWSVARIHEADINRDGRSDLAFWNEDHFEVHLQHEGGMFASAPETFSTQVAFDSDDVFSLAAGDMTGKALHSLADVNGDGDADLVVFSLEGRRISRKRSVYEVHFGEPAPDGGIAFAAEVGASFQSEGSIQLRMDRHNLGNGRFALMFTTIQLRFLESSLWKRVKGFMGDDVWLDLEFHQMVDGSFRDQPNAVRRIALDGSPSHREPGWAPLDVVLRGPTHESRKTQKGWPRAFNRTLLIGDVTGDRRSDLLIEAEFNDLHVFVGVPGPDLFASRPQKVAVELSDEEYAWLVDLNKDGKQDILMHHPFTLRNAHGAPTQPPGTEPHRVTMLIAR